MSVLFGVLYLVICAVSTEGKYFHLQLMPRIQCMSCCYRKILKNILQVFFASTITNSLY